MKAFSVLLILASLLVVGCGEKEQENLDPKIPAKSDARSAVEPDPAPEPDPTPEPESVSDGTPKGSTFTKEDVAEALEVAVDGRENLELREDGLYYGKEDDSAFEGWVKQVSPDGKVTALEMVRNGKKNGMAMNWHQNGQRAMEGEYNDNNYHNVWLAWHQNGEVAGERNYVDGVLDGGFSQSWPNGQTMMEGNYVGGNQDGDWETWHENGERQSAIRYEGGKILGASYWNSNGESIASRPDGSPSSPLR